MVAWVRRYDFTGFGIFLAGLFLFTVGLRQQEIIGFEARFYLFALEMWRHGVSWFPTTYGVPYADYPVTSTLFIYGVAKLLGQLNKFVAVLPSAIAAALTLSVTYSIGALHAKRWGLLAVFFVLLTNTFVMEARTISPDQYVGMVTALCFYLVYSAALFKTSARLWWVPLLLLFGFACRGPIGLVVPAGVVCVFYLLDRNFKQFFLMGGVSLIMLALGCTLLFGMAYHLGGHAFVMEVFYTEVAGRLHDAVLPWYFYFTESVGAYALTFPIVILMFLGWLFQGPACDQKERKLWLQLTGWIAVILIGLSIPAGKKIRYILPMVPALALLSATVLLQRNPHAYQRYLQKIIYGLCFCLPLIFAVGLVLAGLIVSQRASVTTLELLQRLGSNIKFAILVFLLLQLLILVGKKSLQWVIGIAALSFVGFYFWIIEPINLALNAARQFVMAVEAARFQRQAKLVFYQENPDGAPIKYVINMTTAEQPIFIDTPDALLRVNDPAIFVIDPEHFAKLPAGILARTKIIYSGSVGHDHLVVFEKQH